MPPIRVRAGVAAAAILSVFLLAAQLAAQSWPMFGFDSSHSGTNNSEALIGPANVASLDLAWHAPIGLDLRCSPVAAAGVVYVTTSNGGGSPNTASAYDIDTGGLIWRTDYAGADQGSCFAAPAVGGGLIFVTAYNGFIGALDARTGATVWSTTVSGVFGALTYQDGVLYIAARTTARVIALDAATGAVNWQSAQLGNGNEVDNSVAVADGLVIVGQYGDCFNFVCGGLYALDATTGALVWHGGNKAVHFSSPAIADGVVYVAIEGGNLEARDEATGQLLWTGIVGSGFGGNNGTPVVANGLIFLGGYDGKLYAFAVGCGSGGSACAPAWSAWLGPSPIYGVPAVANGLVYIVADDWFNVAHVSAFAIDCISGGGSCAPLWSASLTYWTQTLSIDISSPIVVDGTVLVNGHEATGASALLAFRPTQPLNTPPTFTPPADVTTPATSPAGAVVTFTAVGDDVEEGPLAATCLPGSGATFAIGSTTVTCTVTDASGATASGSFTVNVLDTPPSFTPPADITTTTPSTSATVTYVTPTATDFKDGTVPVICAPPSGSAFSLGATTVTCRATNSSGMTTTHTFTVTVTPQVTLRCDNAVATPSVLWPPNHRLVPISINGVSSANRPARILMTSIFQDEPTNGNADGDTAIDGFGVWTGRALVRAERSGRLNGRVYHIRFTATTSSGAQCSGDVTVGVPHDQKHAPAVDDKPQYDSTKAGKRVDNDEDHDSADEHDRDRKER